MAGSVGTPYVGDFVGLDIGNGDWLYITAVDHARREVKVGACGASGGGWLNECAAQAIYSYTWGKKTPMPMFGYKYDEAHIPTERLGCNPPPDPSTFKCECGSGSDALSGAHSHWCRRYLAP